MWRAGADVSTQLKSEVPLQIGGKTVPVQHDGSSLVAARRDAQDTRPAAPRGRRRHRSGEWVKGSAANVTRAESGLISATGGRFERADLWGSGADYGKSLLAGAGLARGRDVSTQLKTEVPLRWRQAVPAGTHTMFIDLKSATDWTLIVSTWAAQTTYDSGNKAALWGAYNYTPDKDVVRVAMKVDEMPMSVDQLTWGFTDVTTPAGTSCCGGTR